jgi:hypothetical protein
VFIGSPRENLAMATVDTTDAASRAALVAVGAD